MPVLQFRNVLLCLVTVLSVVWICTCDAFIDNLLDEVYNSKQMDDDTKGQNFVSKIWPKISEIVPVPIKIPSFRKAIGKNDQLHESLRFENSIYDEPFFLFTKAMEVKPKLGNILSASIEISENFIECVVRAKLDFLNPVNFEIYVEDSNKQISQHISLNYLFNGENTAKILLKIPNLSMERGNTNSGCIVLIDSFSIEKLGKPSIDERSGNPGVRKVEKQFWDDIKSVDIYTMINSGIMKALSRKFQLETSKAFEGPQKTTPWVCLRNHFESTYDDKKTVKASKRNFKTKKTFSQFKESIRLGIETSVNSFTSQPRRNVLVTDFTSTDIKSFTSDMPEMTNGMQKFTFVTYAPVVFNHLRDFFGTKDEKYLESISQNPLIEISNPGKSGSGLYLTENKYFYVKTVKRREADLLVKLLPKYVLNLHLNPATLLPKFYGFYMYKHFIWNGFNLLVMNNFMPANINIDEKYDLKGSTINRKLTEAELKNLNLTYKDVDFREKYPKGIYLKTIDYETIMNSIRSDTILLSSFEIIDYSLLLGIHYEEEVEEGKSPPCESQNNVQDSSKGENKQKTPSQNMISAWTENGEKLAIFVGILDILQKYDIQKKAEYFMKSFIHERRELSVQNPTFYANRFEHFLGKKVFRKIPPCPAG